MLFGRLLGGFVLQLHLTGGEVLPTQGAPCFPGGAPHLLDELGGFFLHGGSGGSGLFPHLGGLLPHLGGGFLVHLTGGVLHPVDGIIDIHGAVAVLVGLGLLFLIVLLGNLHRSVGGTGSDAQSQQIFKKSHGVTSLFRSLVYVRAAGEKMNRGQGSARRKAHARRRRAYAFRGGNAAHAHFCARRKERQA